MQVAGECGNLGLGADLSIDQLAHQCREPQQLLGEHVPAQLSPPLGMLIEQPQ